MKKRDRLDAFFCPKRTDIEINYKVSVRCSACNATQSLELVRAWFMPLSLPAAMYNATILVCAMSV